MKRRRVIITADDFGAGLQVNRAVEIAHRDGVLTAASLMMAGEAVDDAVERARRLPDLRVGLHVTVVDGVPVLPARHVPDLVGSDGCFDRRLVRAGVRFFFLPRVRRQIDAEIRAQFDAFGATGLALDHVNAHKHMHLHPTILGAILRIGREYGMRALRLPYEPPLGVAPGPQRAWERMVMRPWVAWMRGRLQKAGLHFNEFIFGLSESGRMTEESVLRLLPSLPPGVSEVYFHPAVPAEGPSGATSARDHQSAELAALISPRVRTALEHAGIERIAFGNLP
ncbi:MAG: hopanoid biosynthesis-associated protein HpnK [Acidiferrobacteraceae bacterium]